MHQLINLNSHLLRVQLDPSVSFKASMPTQLFFLPTPTSFRLFVTSFLFVLLCCLLSFGKAKKTGIVNDT